jgi:SIR2-like domain/NB-ARC domain
MAFDPSDATYRRLLDRVLQTEARVVPFVGAGLSAYGPPEDRLPLWPQLLNTLVNEARQLGLIPEGGAPEIEKALDERRYIEATDRILEALGEPTFRRSVERQLDDSDKPVPPAVAELVAVGWSLVVTTNLDRMIWRAYLERHQRPPTSVTNLDTHRLAEAIAGTLSSSETALAQIHGDIGIYPSWKLTRAHYEQLLQDPGYVEALKHLFLRQVFFVGFGLQDGDFDYVCQVIAEIYRAGVGEMYALVAASRREDEAIKRLVRNSGLQPIYYEDDPDPDPDDPFGGHRAVYECLAHLAASWAAAHSDLHVTLKYFPELDPYMVRRDSALERLTELVETGGIVQLVGLGGSGKTSLLQQWLADRRLEIASAGYDAVFGCSLYRADIAQLIHDLAVSTVESSAEPLPQRVERVCRHLEEHRSLLALDGVEVALDEEGHLRNPYLLQIVDAVLRGGGALVLTSRIPVQGAVFAGAPQLEVLPLNSEEVHEFLRQWGLEALDVNAKDRLAKITAGHPLALRVLAGLLLDVPERDAVATIEASSVIDVSDEVDPLRENRLARVIGSYIRHLDETELAFLTCSSVFQGPASFPLVEATLTRPYPDTRVNAKLVGRDLRPTVERLVQRRLLIVGTEAEILSHPTVREYFDRRAREEGASIVPLHRFLAGEYLRGATAQPGNFEEAAPLISAARHAAASHDWTLFDDLFRRRLMRGSTDFLCNNLGAWEETLELARLGDDPTFPASETSEPSYYPFTVARCLKHIGRSGESRAKYRDALRGAAAAQDPHTARYVNNLLTLLVWRGELDAADHLVELNLRALSWIKEEWKHHWQYEHGLSSIAYLRMLQGRLAESLKLFEGAAGAWDGFPEGRRWTFDYYPYYRSELVLLTDPAGHEEALSVIESLLSVAIAERWPESICRGHLQAAAVLLDRSRRFRDPTELAVATERLERARLTRTGMDVADVAIAHRLTEMKIELVRLDLEGGEGADLGGLRDQVYRAETMIDASGLDLARPEATAAHGILAGLAGRAAEARRYFERARSESRIQGNRLAPVSPRSLLNWLGESLGNQEPPEVQFDEPPSAPYLTDLADGGLTSEWMLEHLESLPQPTGRNLPASPEQI